MQTRIITVILIGITIGFLLGMGVVTFLRAIIDGDNPKLYVAFTIFVLLMAGGLVWYVARTFQTNRLL
jgi:hypothetical protein